MKVLIVSTSERTGGAAIAAHRLMEALCHNGIEARMLVQDKKSQDTRVISIRAGLWRKAWERLCILLTNHLHYRGIWKVSIANTGVDITQRAEFKEADVIHLHWVCQGMLSLADIERILRSGKRVVWTMHDQWSFTAVCHLLKDCEAYTSGCLSCPQLRGSTPGNIFRRKEQIYALGNLTFVGCSQWIAQLARRSPLTKGHRVLNIPNPVPQDIFCPTPQAAARQALSLPQDRRLILFAACKVTDTLKGFHYLQEALKLLENDSGLTLLIVGKNSDLRSSLPTIHIPYVSEPKRMALIYAAADVFVTSSVQENLPNTIAEAMSTGTPCVGFRVGGIPEMIDHQVNGYVAQLRNAEDLAQGIRYCLAHDMRQAAADRAAQTYSEREVAQTYLNKVYRTATLRKAPSFTIATVTYNAKATLQTTLESVNEQDYPAVEHLIIDGGSSDGTLDLMKKYEEENQKQGGPHKIRLVSEPDNGLYDAMNKALRLASGDYIVFLNAGDRLHTSDTLSRLASKVKEWDGKQPAILYGETDLVDAKGHFLRHRRLQAPECLSWKSFRNGMVVCHQSFYVRTDLARRETYDLRFHFSADYDWCIRLMRNAASEHLPLMNSRLILTDYLSEGMTTENQRRSLLERLRLMAHHYGWLTTIKQHLWFVIRAVIKR